MVILEHCRTEIPYQAEISNITHLISNRGQLPIKNAYYSVLHSQRMKQRASFIYLYTPQLQQ